MAIESGHKNSLTPFAVLLVLALFVAGCAATCQDAGSSTEPQVTNAQQLECDTRFESLLAKFILIFNTPVVDGRPKDPKSHFGYDLEALGLAELRGSGLEDDRDWLIMKLGGPEALAVAVGYPRQGWEERATRAILEINDSTLTSYPTTGFGYETIGPAWDTKFKGELIVKILRLDGKSNRLDAVLSRELAAESKTLKVPTLCFLAAIGGLEATSKAAIEELRGRLTLDSSKYDLHCVISPGYPDGLGYSSSLVNVVWPEIKAWLQHRIGDPKYVMLCGSIGFSISISCAYGYIHQENEALTGEAQKQYEDQWKNSTGPRKK